ncbi:alpha/beta fold hydrolase [Ferrimonas balearica]|uniref:alpha/beta fold hydrolase n=1 Tax=Ferrimonas balearica TaxID=44012 RepID=UPI001C5886ED|nr:alpha/beta hydrolase [Ferrimonas balearica]MBW3138813.1 alpha/beta hydrolase [Ferrimonas balearica]MBW3163576.1 alpha/beta hydrolase [Ferrimonas balearica]MBY6223526.1 alpha/beta hydrolase [Ferrimonas balearica]
MATLPAAEAITLKLDEISLAAQRWGEHDAPLILALHGWLDNSESFALLAPALAAEGYQVLAPDWAGHGLSDHRAEGNHYPFLEYLYDLHRVMAQLPSPPCCLLGHSMGGIVAQLYAGLYPEEVPALVAIEAVGPLVSESGKAAERLRHGFLSRQKPQGPLQGYDKLAPLVAARARSGDFDERYARMLLARNLEFRGRRWYWRSDPRLRERSAWMMTESQARDYLSGYRKPALVVLGEQGYPQLKSAWPKRKEWFYDVRLDQIPGGHHCHMESVPEMVQTLMNYLSGKPKAC